MLSEIFPYLNSDTVKFNLNLLKEFFVDFRLRINDPKLQKISSGRIDEQYKILAKDMIQDF